MPPAYMYAQHKVQSLTASNAVLATRDESPGSHPAADEQADSTVNTHLVAQASYREFPSCMSSEHALCALA